ncbi:hypothetical protein D9756_004695 [Leucocoprinus leucothites]|uniref:rRNA methyltransferase 2, mitochondrial n=1 Tax=Leucocoprinus leucothites TaxID=201217 RepID=A0A8H5G9C1_9AGAR|nr:hypothetical protein D9756_004695 [Leucoagaricus leucothites]
MRTTNILHATSRSSRNWLSRQFTDPYVRKRVSETHKYRSRSAYKLIEINDQFDIFRPDVRAVVDLGAAPGGWSQFVAEKLGWSDDWVQGNLGVKLEGFGYGKKGAKLNEVYGTWSKPKVGVMGHRKMQRLKEMELEKEAEEMEEEEEKFAEEAEQQQNKPQIFDPLNIDTETSPNLPTGRGTIIAVDLLPMEPIHGVLDIKANFLKPHFSNLIQHLLRENVKGSIESKVDIILSDMAANSTGKSTRDVESSLEICESVFDFATQHLRTAESIGRSNGGVLLMKYFTHPHLEEFSKAKLVPNFKDVRTVKPPASRRESREAYFLCQGWKGLW